MKRHIVVSVVIFVLFVWLVEYLLGWRELLLPWLALSPAMLLVAIGLMLVSYLLRSIRLYDYFACEMSGRFLVAVRVMLQHNMLNNLLPMRTGELSFPMLMAREFNIAAISSVPALFWFRILDLHVLVAMALLALGSYWISLSFAMMASLICLSLPWGLYLGQMRLKRQLQKRSFDSRWHPVVDKLLGSLPQTGQAFWRSWCWTIVNWLVKVGALAWLLQMFANMPLQAAWAGVIAGDVTSVLPIHGIAGAGTYEAGVLFGLMPFSLSAELALGAAINLHLFVLGTAILSGLLSFLIGSRPRVAVSRSSRRDS